eukprot:scaffold313480_cov22-Prasinocladus_malaysianus.AAC.1
MPKFIPVLAFSITSISRGAVGKSLPEIEYQRFEADARLAEAEGSERRAAAAEEQACQLLDRLGELVGERLSSPAASTVLKSAHSLMSRVEDKVARLEQDISEAHQIIADADERQDELEQEIEVCYL